MKTRVLFAFAAGGCLSFPLVMAAQKEGPVVELQTPYDPAGHAIHGGSGRIQGSAFLRTRGGAVVSCAGREAQLLPVTSYTTERVTAIYDDVDEGHHSVEQPFPRFVPEPPSHYFEEARRFSVCDARGEFEFSGLADGDYYVLVDVSWEMSLRPRYAGGGWVERSKTVGEAMIRKVSLRNGRSERVVLSN